MITANEAKELTVQALEESIGADTLGWVRREIKKAASEKQVTTIIYPLPQEKAYDLGRLCALLGYGAELHRIGALGSAVVIRWSDETND